MGLMKKVLWCAARHVVVGVLTAGHGNIALIANDLNDANDAMDYMDAQDVYDAQQYNDIRDAQDVVQGYSYASDVKTAWQGAVYSFGSWLTLAMGA